MELPIRFATVPTFAYSAVNSLGLQVEGTVEAADGNEASAKVKELSLSPTRVTLVTGEAVVNASGTAPARDVKDLLLPTFDYTALNAEGKKIKGSVDAASSADAQVKIKELGLIPVRVVNATSANAGGARQFFLMLIVGLVAWAAVRYMLRMIRDEGPPVPAANAPIIPS